MWPTVELRRVNRQRPPKLRAIRKGKIRRHYADHCIGRAAELNGSPQHARIGAKAALPQRVAEYRHGRVARQCFLSGEASAQHGVDTKKSKHLRSKIGRAHV